MLPFLISETAWLVRVIQAVGLFVVITAFAPALRAEERHGQEPRIAALHGFESAEVRQQGFTLPKAAKVHVYARGGGMRSFIHGRGDQPLFAYGWILNATTREVVWQMDGSNTKRDWDYWVADRYLDLPAGSYEAYFANHGFGQSLLFAQWTRNIDRRSIHTEHQERPHGFLAAFGADESSLLRHWREQVGNYGMEVYLAAGQGAEVASFEAPLRWKNIVVSLPAATDDGHWTQAFHVRKPITLHVYAEGEGSGRNLADYGWIVDARTRARVWEMSMDKSQYAGGAQKNRRQVETIQLPAGDYEASYVTDDSHSPADWNAAPPCDPAFYGLTLSVPADAEASAVSLTDPLHWTVVAELVRVGDDQDRRTTFSLTGPQSLRVYAIGEGHREEMIDEAWIEDASGTRVWTMVRNHTSHAGGATKNRLADELIQLPKGTYTLRFKTDDSHAYGDWNDDAPWDPEHYGVTVYALK
ncbi:hypothetical protein GETHLI_23840 [Geothrix limicola]|uniref:Uncharacterized protein n=1 Tax=Geothrix limicola TaxID=2927978 RepID=A0ABQ5QGB4_9BACT|nr:hypothetical protein [Geothrix limicola]GLH73882.1 hypothetical protein GETHLI_23840 [Geothrix limicola]